MPSKIAAVSLIPQPPTDGIRYSGSVAVPSWIIPMTLAIVNGQGPDAARNGIGVDEWGDLLLYRKICSSDRERLPQLFGIEEIWICIELPATD